MALFGEELITRTKFIVPTPKRSHLVRARLHGLLDGVADVPVAVVIGGTGYGKSSLLAGYLQASATPALWLLLLGVGLCIGLMTLAVQYGLSHTSANQAIIIFLFELVVAAVASWFLANEALTPREWLGGAMIIAGSLFSGSIEQKHESPQPAA